MSSYRRGQDEKALTDDAHISTDAQQPIDAERILREPQSGRGLWISDRTWLLALLIAEATSWKMFAERGVVGLRQDWSIFPFSGQNVAYAAQMFSGWFNSGFGSPVLYPTEYPLRFLEALAASFGADGAFLSKCFIALASGTAFICATSMLRQFGATRFAAWTGALFYALSPVLFNKLIAGQLAYVFSYCALPLVGCAVCGNRDDASLFRRALLSGGAIALAAVQLQLGLIALVFALALIAIGSESSWRKIAVGIGTAVVAVGIEAPTVWGITVSSGDLTSNAMFVEHRVTWLAANSVAPLDALRLSGYLTGYDRAATLPLEPVWTLASIIVGGAALLGLLSLNGLSRIVLPVLCAVLLTFSMGERSVVGPLVVFAFMHVTALQVFRELYHVLGGAALLYAIGIAAAAQRLSGSFVFSSTLRWLLVGAIGIFGAPFLSGDLAGWLRAYPLAAALAPIATSSLVHERVLYAPLEQPLAFQDRGAGVDPLAVTAGGSFWEYSLTWPLTALDDGLRNGDADLLNELRGLRLAAVVDRRDFSSHLATFTTNPGDAQRALLARLPLATVIAIRPRELSPVLREYRIADSPPLDMHLTRVAYAPERLDVASRLLSMGIAPLSFGQTVPATARYDLVVEPDDVLLEAIPERTSSELSVPTENAFGGFAPISGWWWHRKGYGEIARGYLAIGRAQTTLPVSGMLNPCALVGWAASSAGGRLRVTVGSTSAVFDTWGTSQSFHSRAVCAGDSATPSSIRLEALDPNGEVALRAAMVMPHTLLQQRLAAYHRLASGADNIWAVENVPVAYAPARTGVGTDLGVLKNGRAYRLTLTRMPSLSIITPLNFTIASRCDAWHTPCDFDGSGERAYLTAPTRWFLAVSTAAAPLRLRLIRTARVANSSMSSIVMQQVLYNRGWSIGTDAIHLRSVLGTNVFICLHRCVGRSSDAQYRYAAGYAGTFLFGIAILLLSGAAAVQRAVEIRSLGTQRERKSGA